MLKKKRQLIKILYLMHNDTNDIRESKWEREKKKKRKSKHKLST